MAQNPSISFTTSTGKEYRFVLSGQPNAVIPTGLILGMFGFIILAALILTIAGFAVGNLIIGFLGLALLIAPFTLIAYATKVSRS